MKEERKIKLKRDCSTCKFYKGFKCTNSDALSLNGPYFYFDESRSDKCDFHRTQKKISKYLKKIYMVSKIIEIGENEYKLELNLHSLSNLGKLRISYNWFIEYRKKGKRKWLPHNLITQDDEKEIQRFLWHLRNEKTYEIITSRYASIKDGFEELKQKLVDEVKDIALNTDIGKPF